MELLERQMPAIPPPVIGGAFHAFFVFDVADTIDLARLGHIGPAAASRAPLQLRREASSSFIQFPTPPVVVHLPTVPRGLEVAAKFFDYGVISIRLSQPVAGPWREYATAARALRTDEDLPRIARTTLDTILGEIGGALDDPHEALVEDYFVFEVESFAEPVRAQQLLGIYGDALASLVLGEERRMMPAERDEALRVAFAYFEDDLAVLQWDTAFVYDRPEGANATKDILEFANTQLVELRTYDALLDSELDIIYALDPKKTSRRLSRKPAQAAADRLRYLLVDVLELTDRATNALKIIGDAYYARLYRGASGRLGLKDWQKQIDSKLQSVNDMYRFFTDQAAASRGEFLEVVVILLIALELIIGLIQLRH